MGEAKYYHRETRFILRSRDQSWIRIAQGKIKTEGLKMINISSSGLLFSVHEELAPEVGDSILAEFPLSGASNMAVSAEVVRIDLQPDSMVHVAVRFLNLRPSQRANLLLGTRALHKKEKFNAKMGILVDAIALPFIDPRAFSIWMATGAIMTFLFFLSADFRFETLIY